MEVKTVYFLNSFLGTHFCYDRDQYPNYNYNDDNNNNKTKISKQTKLETGGRQW